MNKCWYIAQEFLTGKTEIEYSANNSYSKNAPPMDNMWFETRDDAKEYLNYHLSHSDDIKETQIHKFTLEDFEKFTKEFAEKASRPKTKEKIVEEVFERLKAAFLKKNPYSPTGRFGDNFTQWNFEHYDEIHRLENLLVEYGREDLLLEFEAFAKEQGTIAQKEKEQAAVEELLKVGIDLNKVQDPEVRKYILYKELNK